MSRETRLSIQDLNTLNQIAQTLNQAVDVRGALNSALARLVDLMGLETGWIFLVDPASQERWWGRGYVLAAQTNLPPAMAPDEPEAWDSGCDCQGLCNKGRLTDAYNEVRCSRLAQVSGEKQGLKVHATAPLRVGDQALGILNVAGAGWDSFSPRALALLGNAGSLMGVALERARLYDLLRERRIHEQAALLELSNQLLARPDLDELMAYLAGEARRLLEADACALLLPDEESGELTFSAASGWRSDPVDRAERVPADESSGPGMVMHTGQPLLVEDIQASDPTRWAPDWLRAEGFRGHAVVPLLVEERAVGAMVINSREPRLLDDNEVRFLRLLANQAAIAIEQARLRQEAIQRERLEQELLVAQRIQLSFLPKALPEAPGWQFAAHYAAARQVGGDFYDFFLLPGEAGRWGMLVADVADKGVPAALYMALSRTMIRTVALSGRGPAAALTRANELMLKDSQADTFVSAFYAVLDTRSGDLAYANAGHHRPIWFQAAGGGFHDLAAEGIVLGVFPDVSLEERRVTVAPGDALVFYTDGVTEAMDAEGNLFGAGRLRDVMAAHPGASAAGLLDAVVRAVETFTAGVPRSDDVTLFVVKRV
jgi:sigma-B regulation protein RsbU (phosphoserine phosphatase)